MILNNFKLTAPELEGPPRFHGHIEHRSTEEKHTVEEEHDQPKETAPLMKEVIITETPRVTYQDHNGYYDDQVEEEGQEDSEIEGQEENEKDEDESDDSDDVRMNYCKNINFRCCLFLPSEHINVYQFMLFQKVSVLKYTNQFQFLY